MVPTSLPDLPKTLQDPGESQKPVLLNQQFHRQYDNWDIDTWIDEFRPGNKTIYVVFDEESEFAGPRT